MLTLIGNLVCTVRTFLFLRFRIASEALVLLCSLILGLPPATIKKLHESAFRTYELRGLNVQGSISSIPIPFQILLLLPSVSGFLLLESSVEI